MSNKVFWLSLWFAVFLAMTTNASAGPAPSAQIAVANNFLEPLKKIAARFEQDTGFHVVIIPGSSGKLYTQIANGAPFDIFLSADNERPKLLEVKGFTVPGTRFVYAVGRLVLWSPDPAGIKSAGVETLREKKFKHLAIANPKLSPYGNAAFQAMKALGLWDDLSPMLVQGENIGQTFQFVTSKNAELGFVALSQLLVSEHGGSRWVVPDNLYAPIEQEAVLLKHGQNNPAAGAFLEYLRKKEIVEIINSYGYGLK